MSRPLALVLSCEHGGHEVPDEFASLFAGHEALLQSHRGWDPGALELARALARRLDAPLFETRVTRLLVDANRGPGRRGLFSELSRGLDKATRSAIVERFHAPHRERVADAVARRIADGRRVLHLGIHTFTPVLDGDERRFDVGWLYDPRRPGERAVVDRMIRAVGAARPDVRQRRNAPYLGRADGLTTTLRKRHGDEVYAGIEVEVNQKHPLGPREPWERWIEDLCRALAAGVDGAGNQKQPG